METSVRRSSLRKERSVPFEDEPIKKQRLVKYKDLQKDVTPAIDIDNDIQESEPTKKQRLVKYKDLQRSDSPVIDLACVSHSDSPIIDLACVNHSDSPIIDLTCVERFEDSLVHNSCANGSINANANGSINANQGSAERCDEDHHDGPNDIPAGNAGEIVQDNNRNVNPDVNIPNNNDGHSDDNNADNNGDDNADSSDSEPEMSDHTDTEPSDSDDDEPHINIKHGNDVKRMYLTVDFDELNDLTICSGSDEYGDYDEVIKYIWRLGTDQMPDVHIRRRVSDGTYINDIECPARYFEAYLKGTHIPLRYSLMNKHGEHSWKIVPTNGDRNDTCLANCSIARNNDMPADEE